MVEYVADNNSTYHSQWRTSNSNGRICSR
jgi:hypothetical protein